jgi:hypothetical protein
MRHLLLAMALVAGCGRSEPSASPPPSPEPPPPAPQEENAPAKKPEPPKEPVEFKLDEIRGDKLVPEKVEPRSPSALEHDLMVFACAKKDFEKRLGEHLSKEGPGNPPALKTADDLVLFVLWGRRAGTPVAEAFLDRKTGRIVVAARWTGTGFMKDAKGSPYAGYSFNLGLLESGEYRVWVREATPVDKVGPKLTKTVRFLVDR